MSKPIKRRKKGGEAAVKRELGIARCGLACSLCSENDRCSGCNSGECPDKGWCENRRCSIERGYAHCWECGESCKKGLLSKIKPYGFTLFAKTYGEEALLDCLERNEKAGVVYHREGIIGDYDAFADVDQLIEFIKTGKSADRRERIGMEETSLGKCGFYCGACPSYRSGSCRGCNVEQKRGDCFTRDCVTQKGLPFCGACELFPCDTILTKERCTVLDKAWLRWKKEQKRI